MKYTTKKSLLSYISDEDEAIAAHNQLVFFTAEAIENGNSKYAEEYKAHLPKSSERVQRAQLELAKALQERLGFL